MFIQSTNITIIIIMGCSTLMFTTCEIFYAFIYTLWDVLRIYLHFVGSSTHLFTLCEITSTLMFTYVINIQACISLACILD